MTDTSARLYSLITDASAKLQSATSASFLAEISVRSPRKLFCLYHLKDYFLDKSIQNIFNLILKTEALSATAEQRYQEAKEILFQSLNDPKAKVIVLNKDDKSYDRLVKLSYRRQYHEFTPEERAERKSNRLPDVTYGFKRRPVAPIVTYSVHANIDNPHARADVTLVSAVYTIWESEIVIDTPLGRLKVITPLIGQAHMKNILCAVATCIGMQQTVLPELTIHQIIQAIEACEVCSHWMEICGDVVPRGTGH